jgi:trafficking protein particle complex subunit 8
MNRSVRIRSSIIYLTYCWSQFSSSRRLPTRLFSSTTRRFFGTSSPSPSPMPTATSPSTPNASGTNGAMSWQHRRLAEFATILGDYKLATSVWDSLRKESQSGSDVLPLLLAPSTPLASYVGASLAALGLTEPGVPASAQLRAMVYAVRWEVGVQNFSEIQGERWLAWAAGLVRV